MAVSRAELEAMDRDELVETIVELSHTVEDLKTEVDAIKNRSDRRTGNNLANIKELQSTVEDLKAENQALRERVQDVEATAKGAYTIAQQDQSAEKPKVQIARELTRNLLVTKVANDCPPQDRPVTYSTIKDRAQPEHMLKWQTVIDAWDNLQETWPQFYETSKNGDRALSVRPDEITVSLAKVVQADLERDDLTKSFVGENQGGGE